MIHACFTSDSDSLTSTRNNVAISHSSTFTVQIEQDQVHRSKPFVQPIVFELKMTFSSNEHSHERYNDQRRKLSLYTRSGVLVALIDFSR
jgi:hypothetical protein